jgi:hypothetical protein
MDGLSIHYLSCQYVFYSTEDEVHEGFEYETRGRTQHVAEFWLELAVGERDSNGKHVIGERGDLGGRSHHSLILNLVPPLALVARWLFLSNHVDKQGTKSS